MILLGSMHDIFFSIKRVVFIACLCMFIFPNPIYILHILYEILGDQYFLVKNCQVFLPMYEIKLFIKTSIFFCIHQQSFRSPRSPNNHIY